MYKKAAENGNVDCTYTYMQGFKTKRKRSEYLFFQFAWQRMLGKKYFPTKCKNILFNYKLCHLHYEEIIESQMLLLTHICSFSNLHLSSDSVTWGAKGSFDPFTVCSSVVHTQRSCSRVLCNSRSRQTQWPFYIRQEKSGGNIPRVSTVIKISCYLHWHKALSPKELAKETQLCSVILKWQLSNRSLSDQHEF